MHTRIFCCINILLLGPGLLVAMEQNASSLSLLATVAMEISPKKSLKEVTQEPPQKKESLYIVLKVPQKKQFTNKKPSLTCPACNKKFPNSRSLIRHRIIHSEEKPFVCHYPGCHKAFNRKDHCKRHEVGHKTT